MRADVVVAVVAVVVADVPWQVATNFKGCQKLSSKKSVIEKNEFLDFLVNVLHNFSLFDTSMPF